MRQIQITPELQSTLDKFNRKISKKKEMYSRFCRILFEAFDQVLQEEINVCICCGKECLGKSIGPHYKNSKRCSDYKRELEGREDQGQIPRRILKTKNTNTQVEKQEQVKQERQLEEEKEEKNEKQNQNYDELNQYFDSF